MKYIVYKTTNLINNKTYIGVHATKDPEIFDGYLGCGCYKNKPSSWNQNTNSIFPKAIIKYGVENFIREILFIYPYTEDGENRAYDKEHELVNEDWVKSNDNYNIVLGGKSGKIYDQKKKVRQYDLDGNYIKTWDSIQEAQEIYKGHIGEVCRGSRKTACGFQWRFDSDNLDKIESTSLQNKTVYQFDLSGNLIKVYPSIADAAKQFNNANSAKTGIKRVCEGMTKQAKGYFWSFRCKFEYNADYKKMAVACYNPDGTFVKSFTSLKEACEELNLKDYSGILSVIRGQHKLCKDLRWRFFYGNTSNIKSL